TKLTRASLYQHQRSQSFASPLGHPQTPRPIILMFILSRYFKLLFEFFYFSISGALFYGIFFNAGTNEFNYSSIYESTFAYFFICIAYVIIFFISEKQKPNKVNKSVKSPMKEIITKAQDNYEHNLDEEKQQL
ncbi:MAG: energy-coupled thiamine transporter ThiT, partial [Flavobacteriaceae bacterium]|nr:energy-coupled thiamine transporter ThiT [Flavobacteriaceae bacterium]